MNEINNHIQEEQDDSYSNDDIFNINSWGADLSFRELITMYDEDELIKPELQRNYVWDKIEASRFVESILLGLPVPSIFLANTSDDRKLIIDGYQRIMTIYDFIKGIWSKDNSVFKLSKSDRINTKWQGKAFVELSSSEQRKIKSTTIHAIVFEQIQPHNNDTSLFQVFERINTGGRALLAQEIRNCVYQGPMNSLLFDLNKNAEWRALFGDEIDPRMRDMEYILRYFALKSSKIREVERGNISLRKLLNEYMGDPQNNTPSSVEDARKDFISTMQFIHEHIGSDAFYNTTASDPGRIRKRFYPTIFDSICIATSIAIKSSGANVNTKNLEEKRLDLLQNSSYRSYITQGTMQAESINGRISMALEALYGIKY